MLKIGMNYHIIPACDALYKVETCQESYIVNLDKYTCSCGLWQISGLPCKHAMPCITHIMTTYEKYIAPYFLKNAYLMCYFGIIHPLPNKSKWPHVKADKILPLIVQRPPGMPKTCKKREVDEPPAYKRNFTTCCSYCRDVGHNIKVCPVDPVNAHKKTRHIFVSLKLLRI